MVNTKEIICIICSKPFIQDFRNKHNQITCTPHCRKIYQTKYYALYHQRHRIKKQKYQKIYYQQHKEELKVNQRKYRLDNKKLLKQKQKKNRKNRGNILQEQAKKRYQKNRKERIKYQMTRNTQKRKNNFMFKLNENISKGIRQSLKSRQIRKKKAHWEDIVGYKKEKLIKHIETFFEKGMTWKNYGEWHIDHIVPQSWFKFESIHDKEFKQCWGLKNLQPMWKHQNYSKGNRYSGKHKK